MRHFLTMQDLSASELSHVLALAARVKAHPKKYAHALFQKTLLALFEKPSLRTRISFEAGMTQMGGHMIYYDIHESTIGKKETTADFARVASRYADFLAARVYAHEKLDTMVRHATVPVINLLSDDHHPCQALADLLTLQERLGKLAGVRLAYVGDAGNVASSLLLAGAMSGMHVNVACPEKKRYLPNPAIVQAASAIAQKTGARIGITHDAKEAVSGAHAVYTDTWMSYNDPPRAHRTRKRDLHAYQVNATLMGHAHPNALFMHCLPATRGEEVTEEVLEGKQSAVFDQAENRLHAQKALLLWLSQRRREKGKGQNAKGGNQR